MVFHKNMLQEHLWLLMLNQLEEVPWIWMREVPSLGWRNIGQNITGSGILAWNTSFREKFFVKTPLDLRLCFNRPLGKEVLHDMCREEILAVRERITPDNLESIAKKRFANDPQSLGRCVKQFRNAVENSQNLLGTAHYRPIDDESIHVYYANNMIMRFPDDQGGSSDGGGEDECKCLEFDFERPKGVRPAAVPSPRSRDVRHVPGHQPLPA